MRSHYAAVGVPEDKIVTVPNFVHVADASGKHAGDERGDFWIFVGRLTHDKGIVALVHDWPAGPRLKVVGSGPLESESQDD